MWYVHIHNGILLSHEKRVNAICSSIDRPRDYHTKWSMSDRERQIPYDITYMGNLKYDTNELIYKTENRLTDMENKLMVTKGERQWGGIK